MRKAFQTVALVGPAACMLALAQGPETSTQAILLFTAAVALGSCSSAGFGSSVQDLRSRVRGTRRLVLNPKRLGARAPLYGLCFDLSRDAGVLDKGRVRVRGGGLGDDGRESVCVCVGGGRGG